MFGNGSSADGSREFYANNLWITIESPYLGDMNGSGAVDGADIDLFVQALTNRQAYDLAYPDINADLFGDINGDGLLDLADVGPFRALFTGSGSSDSSASSVPEPSTFTTLAFGLIGLSITSRRTRSRAQDSLCPKK